MPIILSKSDPTFYIPLYLLLKDDSLREGNLSPVNFLRHWELITDGIIRHWWVHLVLSYTDTHTMVFMGDFVFNLYVFM